MTPAVQTEHGMVNRTTSMLDRDLSHGLPAGTLLSSIDSTDWEEYTSWCAGAPDNDDAVNTQQQSEHDRQAALLRKAMEKERLKSDRHVALLIAIGPFMPNPGDSEELLRCKTDAIRELFRQSEA